MTLRFNFQNVPSTKHPLWRVYDSNLIEGAATPLTGMHAHHNSKHNSRKECLEKSLDVSLWKTDQCTEKATREGFFYLFWQRAKRYLGLFPKTHPLCTGAIPIYILLQEYYEETFRNLKRIRGKSIDEIHSEIYRGVLEKSLEELLNKLFSSYLEI